jgi:hypothetical protein
MVPIPHPNIAFSDLADRMKTNDDEVKVPRKLLARLLDLYISFWDFDEEWYLATYSDIQAAVSRGEFASGWAHFRTVGYLEGRFGNRRIRAFMPGGTPSGICPRWTPTTLRNSKR